MWRLGWGRGNGLGSLGRRPFCFGGDVGMFSILVFRMYACMGVRGELLDGFIEDDRGCEILLREIGD